MEKGHFAYPLPLDTDPKKIFLNLLRKKTPQPIMSELSYSYVTSFFSSDVRGQFLSAE